MVTYLLRLQNIKTSLVDVISEAGVKTTLLEEGILPAENDCGDYNESQTRKFEAHELWTTSEIPREQLETTALEAAQRYLVAILESSSPPRGGEGGGYYYFVHISST